MNTVLRQYIRNKSKTKIIGEVVAIAYDQDFGVGWSLCCKKDRYDKNYGHLKATHRAEHQHLHFQDIPHTVWPYFIKMVTRAEKFFKKPWRFQNVLNGPF